MSDTPRTDAESYTFAGSDKVFVPKWLSQKLERELSAAQDALKAERHKVKLLERVRISANALYSAGEEYECDGAMGQFAPLDYWHDLGEALERTEPAEAAPEWIEWHGGECPVTEGQAVDIKFRLGPVNGMTSPSRYTNATRLRWWHDGWGSDIIAYRIVSAPAAESKRGEG